MYKNNKKSKGGKSYGKYTNQKSTDRSGTPEAKDIASTENKVKDLGGSYDTIRSNDINWWNKSPMYADSTRVPFNRIYGSPIAITNSEFDYAAEIGNQAVPGIMTIDFVPTIGSTVNGSNAPVNRAFTSLYGNIYSKTTGAMQFQQADLAMFMIGLTSIANNIAFVKRCLGVSQLYHGQNYYYPKALLSSMGVDPNSVVGHQDEIRMKLNDNILSFNNLKVPDFMDIYKRQYALCHNVYADEDDVQAQLYVFRPTHYYYYEDIESKLTAATVPAIGSSIDAWLTVINNQLQGWRNSSDLGLISGSIQRAFSDSSFIVLDYSMSGDTILPVMDRNITWQINNCIAIPVKAGSLDITQDPVQNKLICDPQTDHTNAKSYVLGDSAYYLNSYDGEIGDEFIMEATRLMAIPKSNMGVDSLEYTNTEIVTGFRLYWYIDDGTGIVSLRESVTFTTVYMVYTDELPMDFSVQLNALNQYSRFKHAPRLRLISKTITGVENWDSGWYGDMYKFTTIDREALIGLNETALQSVYQTNVIS